MSHTKYAFYTVIFFLVSIVLFIATVVQLTTPPTTPTCNGAVMSQGDLCEERSNGTTIGLYRPDQQLQRNKDEHNRNIAMTAGGCAVFLIGGFIALSEARKKR